MNTISEHGNNFRKPSNRELYLFGSFCTGTCIYIRANMEVIAWSERYMWIEMLVLWNVELDVSSCRYFCSSSLCKIQAISGTLMYTEIFQHNVFRGLLHCLLQFSLSFNGNNQKVNAKYFWTLCHLITSDVLNSSRITLEQRSSCELKHRLHFDDEMNCGTHSLGHEGRWGQLLDWVWFLWGDICIATSKIGEKYSVGYIAVHWHFSARCLWMLHCLLQFFLSFEENNRKVHANVFWTLCQAASDVPNSTLGNLEQGNQKERLMNWIWFMWGDICIAT